MDSQAPKAEPLDGSVFIEDVWSRTDPKYRRRAFLLLTITCACSPVWGASRIGYGPELFSHRASTVIGATWRTLSTPLRTPNSRRPDSPWGRSVSNRYRS